MKSIASHLIVLFFLSTQSFAQLKSLDVTFDSKSIAMGESFVANPHSLGSLDGNPAVLSGLSGITAIFTKRMMDWSPYFGNLYYYSLGTAVETPVGTFGFSYRRFEMGEAGVTSSVSPEPIGTVNAYDHTIGLSYAAILNENFSIGITVKTFKNQNSATELVIRGESNTPILFDIGMLYTNSGLMESDFANDKIHLGLSLQNYGTDYKIEERFIKLPRFLLVGFSYKLNIPRDDKYSFFKFMFTGQYKNKLNNIYSIEDDRRDYWGTGFEAIFYDILALRLGGIANPFRSIYGEKGVLTMRYGFGVTIPFELIGWGEYPITLSFDFAAIPLNALNYFATDKKSLEAFNIQISYNSSLF